MNASSERRSWFLESRLRASTCSIFVERQSAFSMNIFARPWSISKYRPHFHEAERHELHPGTARTTAVVCTVSEVTDISVTAATATAKYTDV